jgi:choline dehydrogenase-like flavoprotein
LTFFSNRAEDITSTLLGQKDDEFLAEGTDPTIIAEYVAQKHASARQFQSNKSTLLEIVSADSSSFMSSNSMAEALAPAEVIPGANVVKDAELKAWIRGQIKPNTGHPVGTASLTPRQFGGVVDPDLTVYGTSQLSIADNSNVPLIPSAHTCLTAYAIGEKVGEFNFRCSLQ